MPLGALLGGALGSLIGARPALWVLVAGVPLSALLLVFSPVGRARDLPTTPLDHSDDDTSTHTASLSVGDTGEPVPSPTAGECSPSVRAARRPGRREPHDAQS